MLRDLVGLAIFVALLIALGIGAIQLLQMATDIVVAVLTALGALLLSVFKYSADRLREQEMALAQHKRDNYKELLEAIGDFASGKGNDTPLLVAHTKSWAFASANVVEKTSQFIAAPSQAELKELLVLMRSDMGLPELDDTEKWARVLYKEKATGLKRGDAA